MIPRPFRIHHSDWPLFANAQAVGFGPVNTRFLRRNIQFRQPFFQVIPAFNGFFFAAAFWLSLISAQEYVPLNIADSQIPGYLFQVVGQ